jgi:hypothetical protein
MSENMTPDTGNAMLTVDSAAGAMLGLMGGDDSQEQQVAEQESEEIVTESEVQEYATNDSEEEEGEQVEQPKYRVRVSGEDIEVTQDELVRGYQREADYTKKTQALAEARKSLDTEKAGVEQAKGLRDTYAQRLGMIEQMLTNQNKAENLDELKDIDPIGYAVKVSELSQRKDQLQAIQFERQRIAEQQQAEHKEMIGKHVALEAEKLSAYIPEFLDPEKGETVRKDIRNFAKSIGWTDQELASVYDSRAVMTLYKAMQYDKLIASKPGMQKKVSQAPKMLKAGVSQGKGASEQSKANMQQLRRTGRVADAANVFEQFI